MAGDDKEPFGALRGILTDEDLPERARTRSPVKVEIVSRFDVQRRVVETRRSLLNLVPLEHLVREHARVDTMHVELRDRKTAAVCAERHHLLVGDAVQSVFASVDRVDLEAPIPRTCSLGDADREDRPLLAVEADRVIQVIGMDSYVLLFSERCSVSGPLSGIATVSVRSVAERLRCLGRADGHAILARKDGALVNHAR